MDFNSNATSLEPLDLLSQTWCNSAIQIFQPMMKAGSKEVLGNSKSLDLQSKSIEVDDGEQNSMAQWKLDDVKSWIWLQQAIHPELEYDICFRKKWLSRKINPLKGISIKKWIKELKQKKKEEQRLHKAAVHAAISVAEVAAALAAIAAENAEPESTNALKETAVASAAALVAAQCAKVAEAVGAKHDQLNSAITTAMTVKDPSNIITLTAAAATSLKGAATLRSRVGYKERIKGNAKTLLYEEFDFGKCRESLAKGEELLLGNPDGNYRLRWVSIVQNIKGKVLLKVKKINVFMVFSSTKESFVCRIDENPYEESIEETNNAHSLKMTTSKGKIELLFDDYSQYKKWTMSINHMLILSTTLSNY
ncbi:VAN3-binding protein [Dendrobium catenatum]|uniref:VAN3-binding protein n=1 Tax=Dendrobium catenatum TaxID=906689 RepID=A0A2I0W8N5_9ASPA|nr:VAN3-binding protein [Dendrobium catenatum]PKU72024.1 hypothetical protein MA16_Dca007388 [Dendrobium catenatum]